MRIIRSPSDHENLALLTWYRKSLSFQVRNIKDFWQVFSQTMLQQSSSPIFNTIGSIFHLTIGNVDIILRKIQTWTSVWNIKNGKRNITCSSGCKKGVKLWRIIQVALTMLTGWPYWPRFCYKKMYRCFAVKRGRTVTRSSAELEINVQSTRGNNFLLLTWFNIDYHIYSTKIFRSYLLS